jgi:hypothetical protein
MRFGKRAAGSRFDRLSATLFGNGAFAQAESPALIKGLKSHSRAANRPTRIGHRLPRQRLAGYIP